MIALWTVFGALALPSTTALPVDPNRSLEKILGQRLEVHQHPLTNPIITNASKIPNTKSTSNPTKRWQRVEPGLVDAPNHPAGPKARPGPPGLVVEGTKKPTPEEAAALEDAEEEAAKEQQEKEEEWKAREQEKADASVARQRKEAEEARKKARPEPLPWNGYLENY